MPRQSGISNFDLLLQYIRQDRLIEARILLSTIPLTRQRINFSQTYTPTLLGHLLSLRNYSIETIILRMETIVEILLLMRSLGFNQHFAHNDIILYNIRELQIEQQNENLNEHITNILNILVNTHDNEVPNNQENPLATPQLRPQQPQQGTPPEFTLPVTSDIFATPLEPRPTPQLAPALLLPGAVAEETNHTAQPGSHDELAFGFYASIVRNNNEGVCGCCKWFCCTDIA